MLILNVYKSHLYDLYYVIFFYAAISCCRMVFYGRAVNWMPCTVQHTCASVTGYSCWGSDLWHCDAGSPIWHSTVPLLCSCQQIPLKCLYSNRCEGLPDSALCLCTCRVRYTEVDDNMADTDDVVVPELHKLLEQDSYLVPYKKDYKRR